MAQTLFGRSIELPGFEDRSIYTFVIKSDGAGAGAGATSAAAAAPVSLRGGAAPGATDFAPNLVVIREALEGRDLDRYADEARKVITQRLPAAKLVREGKTQVAGLDAREQEYQVTLERPTPVLYQWHLWVVRDGVGYHLCATSPKDRFEADRKRFRAAIDSWR